MALGGRVLLPRLLAMVAATGSRELFTLAVIATALGTAFGASALFGVSPALGAFFAGVLLGESPLGHQAAAETVPLQRVFVALFFVSVGMLVEPEAIVAAEPDRVTGLRRLYVCLTRAVTSLTVVTEAALPAELTR